MTGNPNKWVLIWKYSAGAIQWIPTWQGWDGDQHILCHCALDESGLSIGRVSMSAYSCESSKDSWPTSLAGKRIRYMCRLLQLLFHKEHSPDTHHGTTITVNLFMPAAADKAWHLIIIAFLIKKSFGQILYGEANADQKPNPQYSFKY